MSLATTGSVAEYTSDGAVTVFSIPFPYQSASDLRVSTIDGAGHESFLVAGAGYIAAGDTVTLTAPATAGWTVRVRRLVPLTQVTEFSQQGQFSPRAWEAALDKLTMAVQQLNDAALVAAGTYDFGSDASAGLVVATSAVTARALNARAADWRNVKDFGATANGSTNDSAAIQAAIDAAYADGGGIVLLPAGVYRLGSTLVLKRGVWLQGQGWSRTGLSRDTASTGPILRPLSDIDAIRIDAAANGAGIHCISIHYPGTAFYSATPTTSTKAAITFTTAPRANPDDDATPDGVTEGVTISNVDVMGFGVALFGPWVDLTSVDIAQYMYCLVHSFHGVRCKAGVVMAGASDMVFFDVHVSDCWGMNLSAILPKVGPITSRGLGGAPSPVPTATATNLIQDLGNCLIQKMAAYACGGDGLILIDCIGATVSDGAFNSCGRHGLNIIGSGNQTRVRSCRIALNGGDGIYITTSTNSVQGLLFSQCRIEGNAHHGIEGVPGVGKGIGAIDIETCDVVDNATAAANTYDAVAIQGSDIRIRGGALGAYGGAPNVRYAFNGNFGGANRWTVTDVDCSGAQVAPKFASASLTLDVRNAKGITDQGWDFLGYISPASKGVGAKVTNAKGITSTIYIQGHATLKVQVVLVDRAGTGVAVGDIAAAGTMSVRLAHGWGIYWGDAGAGYGVPADWRWCGE